MNVRCPRPNRVSAFPEARFGIIKQPTTVVCSPPPLSTTTRRAMSPPSPTAATTHHHHRRGAPRHYQSPTVATAHNRNSRHQPRRERGGNATSPPLAHQTKEHAGDNVATCHVVQTVTMDAIVTVCSMQVSCHLPSPPLRSHQLQGLRCCGRHGNQTTST